MLFSSFDSLRSLGSFGSSGSRKSVKDCTGLLKSRADAAAPSSFTGNPYYNPHHHGLIDLRPEENDDNFGFQGDNFNKYKPKRAACSPRSPVVSNVTVEVYRPSGIPKNIDDAILGRSGFGATGGISRQLTFRVTEPYRIIEPQQSFVDHSALLDSLDGDTQDRDHASPSSLFVGGPGGKVSGREMRD
ncbi:hypothetical protein M011DRAFT_479876 [Sporormia fimetaria CBS 119925]|uniref:Uncharacterized protein n=1 Tax=Sporormia fimetaria CBS 119925 TaxID=1340428 RepID=A0A6A6V215_9PLEO|nr:hypothetical protein M011DRAFT_479876 [Sporormia fimetaria CBS 119925]